MRVRKKEIETNRNYYNISLGFAPIHLAVLSQSADCVHSLCIAGADVDVEVSQRVEKHCELNYNLLSLSLFLIGWKKWSKGSSSRRGIGQFAIDNETDLRLRSGR